MDLSPNHGSFENRERNTLRILEASKDYDEVYTLGAYRIGGEQNLSFLFYENFYTQLNLPFSLFSHEISFPRDKDREQEIFEKAIPVEHRNNYVFTHNVMIRENEYKDVFVYDPNRQLREPWGGVLSDNVIDYSTIIENAKEIRIMDSSFSCLARTLFAPLPSVAKGSRPQGVNLSQKKTVVGRKWANYPTYFSSDWNIEYDNYAVLYHHTTTRFDQDKIVECILDNATEKTTESRFYVDVNAYNGMFLSSTYTLDQNGWKGICIEPLKSAYDILKVVRTGKCFNVAAYNTNTMLPLTVLKGKLEKYSFLQTLDLGSNKNHISLDLIPSFVNQKEKNAFLESSVGNIKNGSTSANVVSTLVSGASTFFERSEITSDTKTDERIERVVNVECVKLESILEKENVKVIDYLSLNTSGSELQVLQGINFDKVRIKIVIVKQRSNECVDHLTKNGFYLLVSINQVETYDETIKILINKDFSFDKTDVFTLINSIVLGNFFV